MDDKIIETYETLTPLMKSMYEEIQALSKKKPEATLSESKVKILNALLVKIRTLLENEGEIDFLYLLDSEALPQYSDSVLILSQYVAALKSFKNKHYYCGANSLSRKWHSKRNYMN